MLTIQHGAVYNETAEPPMPPDEMRFQAALVELSRDQSASLGARLARLCTVAAQTLDVARVSAWLFNEDRSRLRCIQLYDRRDDSHSSRAVLDAVRYPRYFHALEEARIISAADARAHPDTAEFTDGYFDHLGIASTLDVPVRAEGVLAGVVCHEHIGAGRKWTREEEAFAASLADFVALAIESDRRIRYTQRLKILQQMGRAILAAHSTAEIAQAALSGLQDLVPSTLSTVALFGPDSTVAMLIGVTASSDATALGIGSEVAVEVFGEMQELRAGKTTLVADLSQAPSSALRAAMRANGIAAYVSVPLRALGELIGTLNLGSEEGGAFTREHIEIAREVADGLALAIHQTRLHQDVQRHAEELEQRVAERTAELRESEDRIRSVYDNTPVMMHSTDANGCIAEVNQFWLDKMGYQRSEVIGRPLLDFVPPEYLELAREVTRKLVHDGSMREVELHGMKKNGDIIDVLGSSVVKRDAAGNFLFTQTSLIDITEERRAQRESLYLREELRTELNFEEIIGTSPAMQRIFASIEMVATTDATVLLLGETGTGKEVIARALHNRSRRKSSVMVKVNCGALPANLIESELFGHERGAFTGAVGQKKGRFELAHRGSLFLDEVGELPIEAQTKLLRVLQEHEFERVGGTQTVKVDVRVIAATNRNLEQEARRGAFRMDLFYRLNVFPIEVPPLRDRKEDIPLLAAHFVRTFSQRMGRRVERIHRSVLEQLNDYDWPGNVRELANLLERAVILCSGDTLQPQHLSIGRARSSASGSEPLPTLEDGERQLIQRALEKTGGVLAGPNGAAALLGINRSTLWSRMRKLGIEAGAPR
jgi:PAS domain S-box-containing protein